jgi:opacity protein-like surface antigen
MKKIVRLLGGVCVGCAVASVTAQAQDSGPYLKAEVGPTLTEDVTMRDFLGLGGGKIEFDPGMRFGVGGGYSFADWVAIGGETGVSFNYIDNISGNFRGEGDSSIGQVPLLANIVFKLPNKTGLVPFVGAGAGVSFAYFHADDLVFDDPAVSGDETIVDGSEGDAVFAWQLFGGVKYALNDRMSLGLSYKYLHAESPDWEAEDVFTGLDSEISVGDLNTHAVTFIFTFKF